MEWHQLEHEKVCARLGASPDGLSSSEASDRLGRHGPNAIPGSGRKTLLILFLGQFKDFMILVLIGAAVVAGVIGETIDSLVIITIVVLNAIIGFLQEYRAERAMEALKEMAAPHAVVVRDGLSLTIPAAELVPGDLVLLDTGDIIPADLRLLDAVSLNIEEAALTGESVPVAKDPAPIPQANVPLGDRKNMCFKGTLITYGRGIGMVVATGMGTEIGKIATLLLEEKEVKTPLQRRLETFGRRTSQAILALCLIFFCAGVMSGEGLMVMLLTAVSLAVAAIPEALPAVISVSLALGARKLAGANALVRKLPTVETLGSVTYICTDKTGTLTLNRMTVEEVYAGQELLKAREQGLGLQKEMGNEFLWTAMALCNNVRAGADGRFSGDPTETALFSMARDMGMDGLSLVREHPRLSELPFDAQRKLMTTFHLWGGEVVSFTKGAPEAVLSRSGKQLTADGVGPLDREAVARVAARMAEDGLRVLGLGMRRWEHMPGNPACDGENDLLFLGLVGMMDPPRDEALEAVRMCKQAGITPVVISGDHPRTAGTIARRLGIIGDSGTALTTGDELTAMPLDTVKERVGSIRVYARVAPEQKLKIVRALQDKGELVAMTGDGVNDAPALKRADIGIAMGITGTDVARESADLILLDDNFATIVKAVREGRRIYDNIRKFIKYLLTTNFGEIVVVVSAPFIGLPLPLLPVQILWINLMTDALPALALSLEPAEGDVMSRPPRPPQESIFAHGLGLHVIFVGLLMGGLVLGVQGWSLRQGNSHWQTMNFTILCFAQLFHVLAIRSERQSLFTLGLFSNKPLLGAVLFSFTLQLAVVYVPPLNRVFRTTPLGWQELLAAIFVSSIVLFAVELEKMLRRRASLPRNRVQLM